MNRSTPLPLNLLLSATLILAIETACPQLMFAQPATAAAADLGRIDAASNTLAVVPVDEGIEAVVVLDPVRNTLSGYVLNRDTGKFFLRYSYDQLVRDFALASGQKAQFTIIGGSPRFRGVRGDARLANAAIYVAEKQTGKIAAYGLTWKASYRNNPPQAAQMPFVPLDAANFRFPGGEQ